MGNKRKPPPVEHQFKPGQSGNPGGRPKAVFDVARVARTNAPKAFKQIIRVMDNPKTAPSLVVKCAEIVLERAFGKAVNPLHLGGSVEVDHGALHLQALIKVNGEHAERRQLELAKRNGKPEDKPGYRAVTSDDEADTQSDD